MARVLSMKNALLVIALCLISDSCMPMGRKLLNMMVVNQGEVLFETAFDVADTSDESEMWDAAGQCPFSVVNEVDSLTKSGGAQSVVELEGDVAILITWTGEVQAQALLGGATVERCSASCSGWHLTSETVRRAKEVSGL